MSNSKLSGAQRRKLQKEKDDKHNNVMTKVKKLDHFFNVLPSNVSKTSKSNEAAPSSTSSVTESDDSYVKVDQVSELTLDENLTDNYSSANKFIISSLNDPAKWPIIDSETIDFIIRNLSNQDIDKLDFSTSKRLYSSQARYVTRSMFFTKLKNGEMRKREWLIYSESKGSLFCKSCKLFQSTPNTFTQGFNDWKNSDRLYEHERGHDHRVNTNKYALREDVLGARGLAFRGESETFGLRNNGNYLGFLEVLAQFDPFLQNHIRTLGNPGSGHVSYLSKTICDEFINLMYQNITEQIIREIKLNKYFSISVDSTSDVSHTDQLTFIIRYVLESGEPVERFLKFIQLPGHKSSIMETIILDTLLSLGLDINDCRGQSYDNAANMSGAYTGLQARIKQHNPLAFYVPCSAHSLNLVGVTAADCCLQATKFFMFVQKIFVFFSTSTGRWSVLLRHIENSNDTILLPKSLSQTRWSARSDACRALLCGYELFYEALKEISLNPSEKPTTKVETLGLCKSFNKLETGIMTVFWNDVLQRFDKTSKTLQKVTINLCDVVLLYKSLLNYVNELRDRFDDYEVKGKIISKCENYEKDEQRKRNISKRLDKYIENDVILEGKEAMKINTFFVIIDKLVLELSERSKAYTEIDSLFNFFSDLLFICPKILKERTKRLVEKYSNDLEDELYEECLHFKQFLNEIEIEESDKKSPSMFLKILREKKLFQLFQI
ncbi:hypothetical protein QTP88_010627 [Uroleucon formosanum]